MLNKLLTLAGTASKQPVFVTAGALVFASSSLTLWAGVLLLTTLAYTPQINQELEKQQTINSTFSTETIRGRNFFGAVDAVPQVIIETLPETQLNLTLAGLFTSVNTYDAGAIIIDQKKQSHFFSIGEELPGGVILQSIHEDRVVINRNGIYETLFIQDAGLMTARSGNGPNQKNKVNVIRQRIEQLKKQKTRNQ